jgi:inosine-uridine nucleoside N-ribohydrolase
VKYKLVIAVCLVSSILHTNVIGQPKKGPEIVIFDTDIGPDYDDVGAMAMLHAMADKKECTILATVASNKFKYVAPVLDIINTYFGRPDIPIGVVRGNAVNIGAVQKWDSMLVSKYPHDLKTNEQAEDALKLYRRLLAAAKDKSVTIITVGFFTNMANLLDSEADEFSSLTGKELVEKKVKQLVSMAACFNDEIGSFREFNVKMDAPASRKVFDEWPGTIIFSGFEIGVKIHTGLPLVNSKIRNSPVRDVFAWSIPLDPQDKNGRMSWDETAVLVAIRGTYPYYSLVPGRIIGKDDGSNSWDPNKIGHYYLKEKMPVAEVKKIIDNLIMHQPSGRKR